MLMSKLLTTFQPIQFVGRYSVNFGSTSSFTVTFGSSLTGGIDTTPREQDIVFVAIIASSSASRIFSNSSGFTKIDDYYANNSGTTADAVACVFYKVMTSSPDTSIAITVLFSAITPVIQTYVFRNVNGTTPLDVTPTSSLTVTNAAAMTPPTITPITQRALVFVIGTASGTGTLGNVTQTDLTNAASANLSAFADVLIGIKQPAWTSGVVSPADLTAANKRASVILTVALRPK